MSYLCTTYPAATISQQANGCDLPERGPKVIGPNRGHKARLLVGWRHQDDTPEAIQHGRLWCWVGGGKFQVYDETYNRSTKAGEVRFCGPANFTMVRMFHPWFAKTMGGAVPRDMVSEDKEWCRLRYWEAMRRYRMHDESDEEGYNDDDDDELGEGHDSGVEIESLSAGANNFHTRTMPDGFEDNSNDGDIDSNNDNSIDQGTIIGNTQTNTTQSTTDTSISELSFPIANSQSLSTTATESQQLNSNSGNESEKRVKSETTADNSVRLWSIESDQKDLTIANALHSFNEGDGNISTSSPIDSSTPRVIDKRSQDNDNLFIPDEEAAGPRDIATMLHDDPDRDSVKVEGQDGVDMSMFSNQPNQQSLERGDWDDPVVIE